MKQESKTKVVSGILTLNTIFFVLSLAALIVGFMQFESFIMVDLSTMIFTVFFVCMRVKIFFADKNYFMAIDSTDAHFQTGLFLIIVNWIVWLLAGYYIFDNENRATFILLAVAIVFTVFRIIFSTYGHETGTARQYKVAINLVYILFLILLKSLKGSWNFYYEWIALIVLNIIVIADYFISKRFKQMESQN